jgi:hypothetical protein
MPRRSKQLVRQDFKPGPIGWARRRVLPHLARFSALLGVLVLGAWITGRVLTDEHHWSQYLYWTPPIVAIGGAWVLLIFSWLCAKLARRLGGLILRPILLVLALGCSVYTLIWIWHLPRFITRSSERAPNTIRVLHWNQAAKLIDQESWGDRIRDLNADIVLIANAQWGQSRQTMLEQFEYFAPDDRVRWVNYSYRLNADPAHYRVEGAAMIASRFPMIRTGMVEYGSSERKEVMSHSSSGQGWVMFAEFDTDPQRVDDEPLIVWFVDLPSNPTSWKMDELRTARNEIESWDGKGWRMGRHVWEETEFPDASFPEPDVIIGDFNTPRGSASLDLLASGYDDAFEQAGVGRGRSFVIHDGNALENALFAVTDLHIDLAFTRSDIDVTRYQLIRTDECDHTPQLLDIRP